MAWLRHPDEVQGFPRCSRTVKVRFDAKPEEVAQFIYGHHGQQRIEEATRIMSYLASRAVIEVGGDVPSAEQMKQLQAERDQLEERLSQLRRQRVLAGLRNARRWSVPAFSETKISISNDRSIDSNDEFWRDDIVIAHNNDVITLNHCCDVITEELSGLNKRLEALYQSINVQDDSLFVGDVDLGYLETCEMAQEAAENLKDAIRQAVDGMPAIQEEDEL
jgi:uncharacterized protein (DUF342 family)